MDSCRKSNSRGVVVRKQVVRAGPCTNHVPVALVFSQSPSEYHPILPVNNGRADNTNEMLRGVAG